MANNERYSPDNLPGLPIVSPDVIKTYKNQPHTLDEVINKLKQDGNEALVYEFITGVQGIDPRFLEIKRAFAEGALYMYGILDAAAQVNHLEQQFNLDTSGDGDVEDPQPLA